MIKENKNKSTHELVMFLVQEIMGMKNHIGSLKTSMSELNGKLDTLETKVDKGRQRFQRNGLEI